MDVSVELAELSRTIEPALLGKRIRAARVAAGLTQTQLATPEASTAYLSRIESGDRRPDLKLLVRFAEKAGVGLEQLLLGVSSDQQTVLRSQLDEAACALLDDDGDAALALARAVARALGGAPPSAMSVEATLVAARAQRALGDLDAAIIALEDLVSAGPSGRLWLDASVTLTECYADADDSARCIETGEPVLERLDAAGLGDGPHAGATATVVAAAHLARGDRDRALAVCRRTRDSQIRDSAAASRAYRAAAASESSNPNLASSYLAAARSLAEASATRTTTARFRISATEMLLAGPEPDLAAARTALETAATVLAGAAADDPDVVRSRLALARVLWAEGDSDAALAELAVEVDEAQTPVLAASQHLLRGQIQRRSRRAKAASTSFARAAEALAGAESGRAAAQLWFELGTTFGELGDQKASGDAFRRAAAATGLSSAATSPVGPARV